MRQEQLTRRGAVRFMLTGSAMLVGNTSLMRVAVAAQSSEDAVLMQKFKFLSQNGNSNCSIEFLNSIATMPVGARLQGSCCAPMEAERYIEQIKGLVAYRRVPEIPSDPYDIQAGLAHKLMTNYELPLTQPEQAAYDYAMANSEEGGPCCCQCWRWQVYGGLAKLLIRERKFNGPQVTEVWDLSDGCGGEG